MSRYILRLAVVGIVLAAGACARSVPVSPLAAGMAAAREDRWDEAAAHWQRTLVQDPGNAAAHNNLAVAHEKRGAWEEARREYEEALRLDPGNVTIKINFDAFKARFEAARGKST